MTKPTLLILDDEKEVLTALNRALRKEFELFLFSDPVQALAFYRDNPLPLVISDMRMPVMDGAAFLAHVAEVSPRSKRFLLTGHSDINLTVSAVNDGKISHYFAKPWNTDELISELHNAYAIYLSELKSRKLLKTNQVKNTRLSLLNASMASEVNKSKQKLARVATKQAKHFARLKNNFSTFINIYADSIAMHNQEHSKHNYRVASHARYIAEQLECDKLTAFQIYIAGLLYETGKLSLAQSTLNQPYDRLSHHEQSAFDLFYEKSIQILSRVSELSSVVEIIKHMPEHYNGLGQPDRLAAHDIPLGARILALVTAFDNLIIGRQTQAVISVAEAKQRISKHSGSLFDPELTALYFEMLDTLPQASEEQLEFPIDIMQLRIGWVLSQDIETTGSGALLTKDTIIRQSHIDKLMAISKEHDKKFTLFVYAPSAVEELVH